MAESRIGRSAETISRRAFLAAGSAGLVAGPLMSALGTEPSVPDPKAPGPLVLRPAPRKQLTEIPAELLKHVHPEVRIGRVELPPSRNALPLLREAGRRFCDFADFLEGPPHHVEFAYGSPIYTEFEAFEKGGPFPQGEAARAIRNWLAANRHTTEAMDEALKRGGVQCSLNRWLNFMEDIKDDLDPMCLSRTPRFRMLQARVLIADQDYRRAGTEISQLLKLGQIVADADGVVVDQMGGFGIQRRVHDLLSDLARSGELPDEVVAEFIRDIPKWEPSTASIKRACRIEYCFGLGGFNQLSLAPTSELIDTIITETLAVPPDAETRKFMGIKDDDVRNFQHGWRVILRNHPQPLDKIETIELDSSILFQLLQELDRPFNARRRDFVAAVARQVDAWPRYLRLDQTPISFLFGNKELKPPTDGELEVARKTLAKVANPVGKLLASSIPAYEMVFRGIEYHRTNAHATRILLACRRKLDHDGTLPERLEQLVDGKWLDGLPLDPFSGRPFGYSRARALLWSVGDDGQDHQGDWDFEADPPQGKDIVWKLPLAPRRRG